MREERAREGRTLRGADAPVPAPRRAFRAPVQGDLYLWGEWPAHRTGDTGIDLVAIPVNPTAGPVAIQCKFYALGHRIQKADIDSFLSASAKEPFGRRIHTSLGVRSPIEYERHQAAQTTAA